MCDAVPDNTGPLTETALVTEVALVTVRLTVVSPAKSVERTPDTSPVNVIFFEVVNLDADPAVPSIETPVNDCAPDALFSAIDVVPILILLAVYSTVPPEPKAIEEESVPVNVRVFDTVNVFPDSMVNVAGDAGVVILTLL